MNIIELQPFTTEREWTVEGIPVLTTAISVPQPEMSNTTSKISRHIRRYYQLQCRSYLRYCEKWLLPQAEAEYRAALAASTPPPSFQTRLEYRITYQEGSLLSLYTQSREPTLITRRGDTWDLTTGYPVPLSDFFSPHISWKRQLLALAETEIQRQERAGISCYRGDWRHRLRRSFNPQNYYLTADGLAFFFPMYAIAPSVEGIPVFTLPYGTQGLRNLSRHDTDG